MPTTVKLHELTDMLSERLEKEPDSDLAPLIAPLTPPEIGRIIESLPSQQRPPLWNQVPLEKMAEVLLELNSALRRTLIKHTEETLLIESLALVQMDELADLDDDLPISVLNAMVQAMDDQHRQRYNQVRQYPDDTAGGLMDVDAIAVRADVTLKSVLRFMRRIRSRDGNLPEHLDSLMVVDRNNLYLGIVPLSSLVSYDPQLPVHQVMIQGIEAIRPLEPASQVAKRFEDQDLLSAPVADEQGHLVGRITVDDVLDVLRDEADRERLGRAGLAQHPDLFAPIVGTSFHRATWLGINLLTAFLAAWVIGWFEASIEQLVALAVLMPVVASMGGAAGNQTLTLVTRGIALDQVGKTNFWRLVRQELLIGAINGALWALVVALIAVLWFDDPYLGAVFGVALLLAILTGAITGTLIPIGLKQIGVDPALAGGVVLTTATDAVGFFVFLGLASAALL